MTTVYWVLESPGTYIAIHDLRANAAVEEIPLLGKMLVLYDDRGWPVRATHITTEQERGPRLAVVP